MPISINEFNHGIEPQDSELLALLDRQPYKAYELHDLTLISNEPLPQLLEMFTLYTRLSKLLKKGLVKSKLIAGKTYYISTKAK